MLNDIITEIEDKIKKTIDTLKIEFSKISTNKTNINLLNDIKIKYYDEIYKLNQISVITIEDGSSIIIKPFDKKNITSISKEIVDLNLDLNPFIHGDLIKVIFPKMTTERRELFVKKAKKISEEMKISIRNTRKIYIQKIKNTSKENKISQDEEKIKLTKLDNMISKFNDNIDEITNKKITELLKF
ncbi:MAG TPA: ribosome-recycling factor [Candidatus Azoamicus sp.]